MEALPALLWPLLGVLALWGPLVLLKRWIHEHLQRLGTALGAGEAPYFLAYLLFLPGVALHELSHWAAGKLLGVRTGRVGLWPSRVRQGWVRLGYVEIGPTDALRESLIGLAPLLTGAAGVLFITAHVVRLGGLQPFLERGDWLGVWARLGDVPDLWLWVYLVFATSNAMLPSPSDRRPWLSLALFLGLLAALAYAAGLSLPLPERSAEWLAQGLGYLALSLALAGAVDLLFMMVIGLVELVVRPDSA